MNQSWTVAVIIAIITVFIVTLCCIGATADGHSAWNFLWVPCSGGVVLLIEWVSPGFWYGAIDRNGYNKRGY